MPYAYAVPLLLCVFVGLLLGLLLWGVLHTRRCEIDDAMTGGHGVLVGLLLLSVLALGAFLAYVLLGFRP
jgi:urea transporter